MSTVLDTGRSFATEPHGAQEFDERRNDSALCMIDSVTGDSMAVEREKWFGRIRIPAAAAVLAALTTVVLPSQALAQGAVRSKHGDWELRCETPTGASKEQCALIQSVAAEDKPNVNLVVIVLKTADGKSRLLRVLAPLGVLLPSGLGLKIDDIDVGRAGFVRCLPTGCVAEVVMEEKLIGQMKSGVKATFIIFQTPEEGIGIPLTIT